MKLSETLVLLQNNLVCVIYGDAEKTGLLMVTCEFIKTFSFRTIQMFS